MIGQALTYLQRFPPMMITTDPHPYIAMLQPPPAWTTLDDAPTDYALLQAMRYKKNDSSSSLQGKKSQKQERRHCWQEQYSLARMAVGMPPPTKKNITSLYRRMWRIPCWGLAGVVVIIITTLAVYDPTLVLSLVTTTARKCTTPAPVAEVLFWTTSTIDNSIPVWNQKTDNDIWINKTLELATIQSTGVVVAALTTTNDSKPIRKPSNDVWINKKLVRRNIQNIERRRTGEVTALMTTKDSKPVLKRSHVLTNKLERRKIQKMIERRKEKRQWNDVQQQQTKEETEKDVNKMQEEQCKLTTTTLDECLGQLETTNQLTSTQDTWINKNDLDESAEHHNSILIHKSNPPNQNQKKKSRHQEPPLQMQPAVVVAKKKGLFGKIKSMFPPKRRKQSSSSSSPQEEAPEQPVPKKKGLFLAKVQAILLKREKK